MILVIGASGQVGNALLREFNSKAMPAIGTYDSREFPDGLKLSLGDEKSVFAAFEKTKPGIAILSGAMTNVDLCEKEPEMCMKTNVEGAKMVASACKEFETKPVYISTDYVFDGENGPYSEEDAPNPINAYGKSKLDAEKIFSAIKNSLVIRTTWVFSAADSKNFASRLARSLKAGENVKVPMDQFGNPTLAESLAQGIAQLCVKEKKGTYHVAGRDVISRVEFARMIAKELALDWRFIKPVGTREFGQPAKRPLKGGLRVEKFEREIGRLPSAGEAVKKFKSQFVF